MSDLGSSFNQPLNVEWPEPARRHSWWERIEAILERGSEWLNPILVKEARQALKSRQFVITFTLLLLLGWIWTIFGVFLSAPGIFYGAEGKGMLYGYFLVLAVPLLVVVPFSAFRSLAAEREDGTYELISITALNARQIVSGKLGSAVLQMMVYFSALAPCVAFTYLLRGVDIFSIFFVLYYTFLVSLLLSTFGLLIATATRSRAWQVLLSVLLLLVLFLCGFGWVMFTYMSLYEDIWRADLWEFWIVQGFVLTQFVMFFMLFLWAAGAQISFPSDNRSTRMRYIMFLHQATFVGWMTYFVFTFGNEPEIGVFMMITGTIYWALLGSLLIGEYPQLSPRVRRELPQSFLGRMIWTWFNPGTGTGYVFMSLNLSFLALAAIFVLSVPDHMSRQMIINMGGGVVQSSPNVDFSLSAFIEQLYNNSDEVTFVLLAAAYVVAYLGMSRLVVLLARQVATVGLVFSLLITIFFVIAGAALPWILQFWLFNYRNEGYTILQMTNWAWTLEETLDRGIWNHWPAPVGVFLSATVIFLINLILTAGEVSQVRLAAPQRVQDEETALHPPKPKRSSPWDDEEPQLADLPPGA